MTRRRRFENPGEARFVTFSCQHRLPLFSNDRIAEAFVDHLGRVRDKLGFGLVAWVVMPEHVHLLALPRSGEAEMPRILQAIKQPFAKRVLHRWRELEAPVLEQLVDDAGMARFWLRGGGYDRNITSDHEWFEKVDYIHQNPVTRGLVGAATDYPWSSARAHAHDPRAGAVRPDLDRRHR